MSAEQLQIDLSPEAEILYTAFKVPYTKQQQEEAALLEYDFEDDVRTAQTINSVTRMAQECDVIKIMAFKNGNLRVAMDAIKTKAKIVGRLVDVKIGDSKRELTVDEICKLIDSENGGVF